MPNETALMPPQTDADVFAWLEARMQDGLPFLLAHADDGVVWGKLVEQKLITSRDAAGESAREISPLLRGITLQQAFVFGPSGEVRLWRDDSGWQCYQCSSADELAFASPSLPDEWQVLWGTKVINEGDTKYGFTHIHEARQQGLDHIVPVQVSEQQLRERRLRLQVRHFIERDPDTGEARLSFSRLVNLVIQEEQ